jgi:hypothetical protein
MGQVIKKMPASGGPAQTLATSRVNIRIRETTWTKDGHLMWTTQDGSVMSVPAIGGESTPLFKADDKVAVFRPQLLANNSLLLTTMPFGANPGEGEVVAIRLGTGEKKTVQSDAWAGPSSFRSSRLRARFGYLGGAFRYRSARSCWHGDTRRPRRAC